MFLVGLLAIQKKLDNARIAIAGLAAVCALLFSESELYGGKGEPCSRLCCYLTVAEPLLPPSLLLAVEASNETLDMLNNINLGIFQPQNGYGYYRLRTLAAGSICVAGFNCIMILAAGIVSSDSEIAAKQATQAV